MDKKSLKIARKLKKEIEKEFKVLDMRIFGSRARDDYEKDSDLDIFIELEKISPEIRDKIFQLEWKVGFENGIVIMTIIHSKDEIVNGIYRYTPIYKNILRESIIV